MGAGHSVTALYEIAPAGERVDMPGVDPLKYQTRSQLSAQAWQGEAMTVKFRYKAPDADTSSLLELVVPARLSMSANLGFAAAVAEFKCSFDSEFKGPHRFAARAMAERYPGVDSMVIAGVGTIEKVRR